MAEAKNLESLDYGITTEGIINGDVPEFTDADRKMRRDKTAPLYSGEIVDDILQAAFADLKDALDNEDRLMADKQALTGELDKFNALSQRFERADRELKDALAQLSKAQADLTSVKSKSVQLKAQADDIQKQYNEAQSTLSQVRKQLDGSQNTNADLRRQTEEAAKALEQANKDKAELEQQLEEYNNQSKMLAESVNKVITALNEKYGELISASAKLSAEAERLENQ